jgi:hypothetical protein
MKTLLTLLLVIPSFSFAACPDLSGHYAVCRSWKNILIEGTDMNVQKIDVPNNTFYKISFLADGNNERETLLFPANGIEVKISDEQIMSARCLGNLVQARTTITRDGEVLVSETSQYYKQGDNLVRISRGKVGEVSYTDILTCRP